MLLELRESARFEALSGRLLKLVEEYLCTVDIWNMQEDNSLLFGSHGAAWFLYDFYRGRDAEKAEKAVCFALSLPGQSEVQDYALGIAGYGCTYLKFYKETGNAAFLDKAAAAADCICNPFFGVQERAMKEAEGLGFAHGEAGLLYFMQMMCAATGAAKYRAYMEARLPAYLERVEAEIKSCRLKEKKPDVSWCKGFAGIGTALLAIWQQGQKTEIYPLLRDISKILTDFMWAQSNCQCHGNAGSVEFLMDMFDATGDASFLYQARVAAKYIYTQRFYDGQGHMQFTDETKWNAVYDYGTGAAGAMRAVLRACGYVHGRLYMR